MPHSSPGLIDILRSVLARLDEDAPDGANDPALIEFKRRILRSIAELDFQRKSLQPPDVLLPESEPPPAENRPFPSPVTSGPPPPATAHPHLASPPISGPASPAVDATLPQSPVTVLVGRQPRNPPDDGGQSSAA